MKAVLIFDIGNKNIDDLTVDLDVFEKDKNISFHANQRLRALPKKKPMKSNFMQYQHGWNDCLDEITGETE